MSVNLIIKKKNAVYASAFRTQVLHPRAHTQGAELQPLQLLPAAISCRKPKMRDTDRLLIGKLIAIVSSSRNTRQLFS